MSPEDYESARDQASLRTHRNAGISGTGSPRRENDDVAAETASNPPAEQDVSSRPVLQRPGDDDDPREVPQVRDDEAEEVRESASWGPTDEEKAPEGIIRGPEDSRTEAQDEGAASIERFIEYAYSRRGQRLSQEDAKRLDVPDDLDEKQLAAIRSGAAEDLLFRVPWQMMATALRVRRRRDLAPLAARMAREALATHPLAAPKDVGALPVPEGKPGETEPGSSSLTSGAARPLAGLLAPVVDALDEIVRSRGDADVGLVTRALTRIQDVPDDVSELLGPTLKNATKEGEELRANVMNTVVLAASVLMEWPVRQTAAVLHEHSWRRSTAGKTEPPEVALTANPDGEVLGLVVGLWERMADEARAATEAAQRELDAVLRHVTQLREELQQAADENAGLLADAERLATLVDDLNAQVADRDRKLSETHTLASYDYEQLRTRWIQRAKRQLDLLQDGLHALRREDPKLPVTDDRLEQAINGLEADLDHLRAGGNT